MQCRERGIERRRRTGGGWSVGSSCAEMTAVAGTRAVKLTRYGAAVVKGVDRQEVRGGIVVLKEQLL